MNLDSAWQTRGSLVGQLDATDTTAQNEAWARFDQQYGRLLEAYARGMKLGLSPAEAYEARQQTTVAAWQSLASYDPKQGRFRDWLQGILRHKVKDILRKRNAGANGRAVPLNGALLAVLAAPAAAAEEETEADWDAGWRRKLRVLGLERLRAEYPRVAEHTWQVVWELFGEGRKPAKVMARLGLSKNKVYDVGTEWRDLFATAVRIVRREQGEEAP